MQLYDIGENFMFLCLQAQVECQVEFLFFILHL